MRSSFATVSFRRPSISGRATEAFTGVTRWSQYEERRGVSTGTSTISGRLPRSIPNPLDHLPIGHHVRPANVEARPDRLGKTADTGEVLDDVHDGDRLGTYADPARAHHCRQAVHERDDRFEAGAAAADHDRSSQRGQRDGTGGELLLGLESATEVRRQLRRIVAEAAQVDELAKPGPPGLRGDGTGRGEIALLEVTRAERVHEVIGDVDPLESPADGFCVARVGPQPVHSAALPFASRQRDDVMRPRESRQQSGADGAGRAKDGDFHHASRPSRAKWRRLISECRRACT